MLYQHLLFPGVEFWLHLHLRIVESSAGRVSNLIHSFIYGCVMICIFSAVLSERDVCYPSVVHTEHLERFYFDQF